MYSIIREAEAPAGISADLGRPGSKIAKPTTQSLRSSICADQGDRMIARRRLVLAAGMVPLACPLAVSAQTPGRTWRIGYLSGGFPPPDRAPASPLREELRALGYVEGKNISFEGRWAELRNERLTAAANDLIGNKVDVVVAVGWAAAKEISRATSTVPVVFLSAGDAVEAGLVPSLAHPGGNLTGVNDPAGTLSAKRLELLKDLVPSARRVAVLWNAANYAMTLRYEEIRRAAELLHIEIEPLGVREPDDFDDALGAMNRERPDALMMVTDALTNLNRRRVIDYAAEHRIPAMYEFGSVVHAGGLISYGADDDANFRLAAQYVAKVLRGAKPGNLPVEQPNEYFLVINLRTAEALGLTVPQGLLLRAAEVVR
ncbi:ABC transporter substrate-binding protein [Variovorax sp. YR216]|uniref:ABC transporter substrate-binding protein n=1 Tax=Variovorax sp. YR216 TaxID=1882828 RepID=UPI00115FCBB5|nr:ABC transporter substrate-binding protein [Variovorax sp. YR216]